MAEEGFGVQGNLGSATRRLTEPWRAKRATLGSLVGFSV